ncbi:MULTISPECIES: carbohydrate ABC transporter permease [Haloarcula]|uniref:Sugar ABC transporter permease n=1 Tax=Haloarcula pellucida TaxID=1427151 RepID=A0A830GGM6_9EURY|nr:MULTISPECIES: sugar ABC transporter permease [Halomicroarcula]MBX0346801.1 sugar ABC transporter permease [Halomicroarcula pellucida]MDS0277321.1 sugar ABC transporter permease [Halomicroarcula sp. S1AR25-4]GGN85559.1 sugar ABC transporter permease [Halomicroarcula pellucida]
MSTEKQSLRRKLDRLFVPLTVGPTMLWIAGIIVYPTLKLLWSSVFWTNPITSQKEFVGLRNFKRLIFAEGGSGTFLGLAPDFVSITWHTFVYVGLSVSISFALGLGIALLLDKDLKGRGWFRTAVIVPWILPYVMSGLMWRWMFNSEYGAINGILTQSGLLSSKIAFFSDGTLSMMALVIADIWVFTPFIIIILLAGLQNVPEQLYDAAEVDGAGKISRFVNVTYPFLKPSILVALTIRIIFDIRALDLVWVMTQGGPGKSTEVWASWLYRTAQVFNRPGEGAALGVVLLAVTFMIVALLYKVFGESPY